ncbi:MAG TPA: glycosyltransferase family 87 protein [Anaeromyxobacteraceae bacterium]|nr:glycosyltransferase family 87 protein [Anaeromyxobacteraceae bacterium]
MFLALPQRLVLPVTLVPLLLVGMHRAETWTGRSRRAATVAAAIVLALLGLREIHTVLPNIERPAEWDFMCFWLWGKLGARGLSFYDPRASMALAGQLANRFDFSRAFVREVLQVGFWYPPPAMLLFAPLGFFSASTAAALWYLLQQGALLGAALLLWRQFARGTGRLGFLLVLALMLCMPASSMTLALAQTNFLVLLLALLLWKDAPSSRGGVWAALSVLTKPYLIIWFAYLALSRRMKALVAGIATGTALCALTALCFGGSVFVAYLARNPTRRLPPEVFSESVNQSLAATLLRLSGRGIDGLASWQLALFAALLIGLAGATGYLVYRLRECEPALGFGLTITTGLIAFPSTLAHYGVLLFFPLFLLWSRRREWRLRMALLVPFVTAIVTLTGSHAFWSNVAVWCALVAIAARVLAEAKSNRLAPGGSPQLDAA